MSLDISLTIEGARVFDWNITHNLNTMAGEVNLYLHLWRPEELEITQAKQLIEPLSKGLSLLVCNKDEFTQFNPENGWGDFDGLVKFIIEYLAACKKYPEAIIHACR